jgi:4-hydroxythreonine-4-phosphate dehydrogenase
MIQKPLIGISMGDPNGIGLELIIKTLGHAFILEYCTPVIYAYPQAITYVKNKMGVKEPVFDAIDSISSAQEGMLNLITIGEKNNYQIQPGTPSREGGELALEAIDRMMEDVMSGALKAIVTAPVDKSVIALSNPGFSGHTGYLAKALQVDDYLMILYNQDIRVGLLTEHIPLSQVSSTIHQDLIVKKTRVLIASLRKDFGITKPKIAILGLNPHAGDKGLIGMEEKEMIIPAIQRLQEEPHAVVYGPYAADSFWTRKNMESFDAVLAMYHDQGLAPFKALSFETGVNFTAGLPVVRTSPDHGTAYDIANEYNASPASFEESLFQAIRLLKFREENEDLARHYLPLLEHKRERFRLETRGLDAI